MAETKTAKKVETNTENKTEATKKPAAATKKPAAAAKKPKKVDYWDELVPVFLRSPEGEEGLSRTVTINGFNYQVQYDKEVMVPRKVKAVLDEAETNRRIADEEIRQRAGIHELGTV